MLQGNGATPIVTQQMTGFTDVTQSSVLASNGTPQLNTRGFSTRTSSNSDSWESDSDQWPVTVTSKAITDSQWQARLQCADSQWQTRTINGSQWQGKHNKLGQWNDEEGMIGTAQKRTYGGGNSVSMKLATPLVYHRSYATRNQRQGKAYV